MIIVALIFLGIIRKESVLLLFLILAEFGILDLAVLCKLLFGRDTTFIKELKKSAKLFPKIMLAALTGSITEHAARTDKMRKDISAFNSATTNNPDFDSICRKINSRNNKYNRKR